MNPSRGSYQRGWLCARRHLRHRNLFEHIVPHTQARVHEHAHEQPSLAACPSAQGMDSLGGKGRGLTARVASSSGSAPRAARTLIGPLSSIYGAASALVRWQGAGVGSDGCRTAGTATALRTM